MNIDPKYCIGNATDGAANMQGVYSLFGILQGCAVFTRESYKRMDIWTTKNSKKKICTIGETRWWSKDAALSIIIVFGHFNEPGNGLYVDLIKTLDEIENNLGITLDARYMAKNLKEVLLKYETILTAQMYLRIFKKTTPLSKYLQGHGVNIISAYQMVKQTLYDLQDFARQFHSIKEAANTFVEYTNKKFDEMENNTLEILNELPHSRIRKRKRQFTDYESIDDPITDPLRSFEINVYNQVFDTVIESISSRFEKHEQLCADFYFLDPNNFQPDLPLPTNALIKVYEKIRNFIPDITYDDLRNEYVDFTCKWRELKNHYLCV